MARLSKKHQIAQAALPLFLVNGFKGTSVDLVVKASGVSKPTVYKHFPDKASLMAFVMQTWLAQSPVTALEGALASPVRASRSDPNFNSQLVSKIESKFDDKLAAFKEALSEQPWLPETFQLYRIVLAEGWRFTIAREAFYEQFERECRQRIADWAITQGLSVPAAQAVFGQFVLEQLWCVPRESTP